MIIGPKYKIARRLGAPIFEKTQTQKYQLSQARKEKSGKRGFARPKSEYGMQLLEKQKARYTYCLTERQFSKYAKLALSKKDKNAIPRLFESLELRADNTVYRIGFASTRLAAKQMVGHGHITVNGKRITIPSYRLSMGDVIGLREASVGKALFSELDERLKAKTVPSWIKFDFDKKIGTVVGIPKYEGADSQFDLNAVLEFYSR
jgi:small subunit ribosomal protein S4